MRNGECIAKYTGSDYNFPELGNPNKCKIFTLLVHSIDIPTKGNLTFPSAIHLP